MGMFDFPSNGFPNQQTAQPTQPTAPPAQAIPPQQFPQNVAPPPAQQWNPAPGFQQQPVAPPQQPQWPAQSAPGAYGGYPPQGAPAVPAADYDDFDGIGEAALKQGGTRYPQLFSDGQCSHILCIDKIRWMKTRKGPFQYLVEFRVVASNNPRVPPGTPRTYIEQQGKEGWDGRVARFIMGSMGIPGKDVDKAGTRATFADAQPLSGILVVSDMSPASNKKDNNGQPFINVNFRPLSAAEFHAASTAMQQLDQAWRPNQLQPSIRFAAQGQPAR